MPEQIVWTEFDADGPIRIFKNLKAASASPAFDAKLVHEMLRADAVNLIRRRIFQRDNNCCTNCGKPVNLDIGQMHERQWRGRGGEISLENGTCLCYTCHNNSEIAGHGKRKVRFR